MNYLNSILIEGTVTMRDDNVNDRQFVFTIASKRFEKIDDMITEKSISVPIITRGKLANSCAEYLELGRGLRVVGRLADHGSIVAEHVEFKSWKSVAEEAEAETVSV